MSLDQQYAVPAFAAVFALWSAATAAADPDVRTGKWETTVVMEMNGMTVPARVKSRCITKEDLVPPTEALERSGECKMLERNISGSTVTWKLRCETGDGVSEGVGTIRYQGERYSGDIRMTMQSRSMGPVTMTQKLTGRRIGDC